MKTFKEWSSLGYKIKKGSKATWIDNVAMFDKKQVEKIETKYSQHTYNTTYHSTDLLSAVKTQMHMFGWGHDNVAQLVDWVVDSDEDYYDELGNETDHWMNTRPY